MVDGQANASSEGLGNLDFVLDGMNYVGIDFSLKGVLMVMLFFFVMKGAARFVESFYKVIILQYFIKRLRYSNVDALSDLQYKFFVGSDPGRIQNTLSGETGRVVNAYRAYMSTIQAVVMLTVYVFLAYSANAQFALLVSIGGIVSNFAFRFIYKKTKETSKRITSDSHGFQGLLIQMVAYFKYLKATGLIYPFGDKLKTSIDQIEESNRKIGFYNSILQSVREPIVITVVVCVILVQVNYFGQSLGLIILSLLFFYRALTFVLALQTEWNKFLNVSGSLENMTSFQNELADNTEEFGKYDLEHFDSEISLDRVSFNYGDKPILRDISLKIYKNETIAFVGESGAGKSTLVNLLAGLMPIDRGELKVDGVSIHELNIKSYQKRVGYITQEPIVFNGTIFENVTFWAEKSEKNLNRFYHALKQASIFDFVLGLSDREDELLGNNGINLSGGQKQRISIARELYKEIDILIMDEATSALDSETELVIKESVDRLRNQLTVFIVAHRLSTIKEADKIVLMKEGRIVEVESFDLLINRSNDFRRMVNLQGINDV